MADKSYTTIRVTKNVNKMLKDYSTKCYADLSLNSMLQVLLDDLNSGYVKFPDYGIFECPTHRKERLRDAAAKIIASQEGVSDVSMAGSLPEMFTLARRRIQWELWMFPRLHYGVLVLKGQF